MGIIGAEKMKKQEALVSIVALSYNASRYILELLESIKQQTYKNIELIIADDASRDNTVWIVNEWLKENGAYFTRYEVCALKENKGTVCNLNGALKRCTGDYVKIIAADDMLFSTCIEDCLTYCESNQVQVVIGDALWVLDDGVTETPHNEIPGEKEAFYSCDALGQYKLLLESNNVICTPGEFFKRVFLERYGYFDEKYDIIEDYPFWLKITSAGEKIYYLDKKVVKYRQSATSATNPEKNTTIYNVRASKASKRIFYDWRFKSLLREGKYRLAFRDVRRYFIRDLVIALGNSRKNIVCYGLTRFE